MKGLAVMLMALLAPLAWAEPEREVRVVNREPIVVRLAPEGHGKPTLVEVESTPARPVWVRKSEPERRPFQWTGQARWADGQEETRLDLRIPPGRRLRLEQVSAHARLPKGQFVPAVQIATVVGGEGATHYLPLNPVGAVGLVQHFTGHHVTRMGADAHSIVTIILPRSAREGEARLWITLSGYLE